MSVTIVENTVSVSGNEDSVIVRRAAVSNVVESNVAIPLVWGNIDGALSNQTDLQNALDEKLDSVVAGVNISIDNTDPNNPIINSLSDRYKTISNTSQTIDSNVTLTFTIQENLSYVSQQEVIIAYDANNHMHGTVVSYSGTSLIVDIKHKTGSGTYSAWSINLDGTPVDAITGSGNINEIAYFAGGQVIGSLDVSTYPSLTELSYVKDASSNLQAQLNNKADYGYVSGNFVPYSGAITDVNIGSQTFYAKRGTFQDLSSFKTPTAPTSVSISFTADAGGIVSNGNYSNWCLYAIYQDPSTGNYAYDAMGMYTFVSEPSDFNTYNIDFAWSGEVDANYIAIYNFNLNEFIIVSNTGSTSVNGSTSWTSGTVPNSPTSLYVAGNPLVINPGQSYSTDNFEVMRFGTNGGSYALAFNWYYAGGFGTGGLRFEDTSGTLQTLNANIAADTITVSNQLTAGTLSGFVYPTTFAANYVAFGASGAYVTGSAGFTWNNTSTRLWLSNISGTAQSQLHMHRSTAVAVASQYTNSSTGSTSTDGLAVGISSTGVAEIRNYEATAIQVFTSNTQRLSIGASGGLTVDMPASAVGGVTGVAVTSNTWTNSTLVNKIFNATATINQSGTAGFTLMDFSYALNSVGSGEANLLRFSQTGSDYFKVAASGQVTTRLGSNTVPSYSFVGDTDTGIYSSGANALDIVTGAAASLRCDSAAKVLVKQGGTTNLSGVMTTAWASNTTIGNVGIGEDDLRSFTTAASTLNSNADSIRFDAVGLFAANANNKRVRVYFGGTLIFDTTALAFNGGNWRITGKIARTTTTTADIIVTWTSSNTTLQFSQTFTAFSGNLLASNILKLTAEATADNDVTQRNFQVWWQPG